jgi:hypothetical protein
VFFSPKNLILPIKSTIFNKNTYIMTFLAISLLVFGISILFFTILAIIWWRKFGKDLFSSLKTLKNMENQQNMLGNMGNLGNLEEFYKNMGNFGGQMGNFNSRMSDFAKKMGDFSKKVGKK